jgi:peptidyl-prolyl cis-trans isomerase SurA
VIRAALRRAALGLSWLVACAPAWGTERLVDRIAAVVNDDVILLSQIYLLGSQAIDEQCVDPFDAPCRAEIEGLVLDALIRQQLVRQELIRLGYDVTPAEVQAAIQQVLVQYELPDREALRNEIEETGADWTAYLDKLQDDLRGQRFQDVVLRSRVSVNDDELRDFYDRLVRELDAPDVVRLSGLGFRLPSDVKPEEVPLFVEKLAAELDAVRSGARAWEDFVATWDTARLSRLFEGRAFGADELAGPLSDVAFATAPGDTSAPVVAGGVIYVVRVLGREKGVAEAPPFEDVKDQVAGRVFEEKLIEAEDQWYASARRQAAVRVLLDIPMPDPNATTLDTAEPPASP